LTLSIIVMKTEIAGERHSNACHLFVMNLTSICGKLETFA